MRMKKNKLPYLCILAVMMGAAFQANAGSVQSDQEHSNVLSVFVEKVGTTTAYIDEIAEVVTFQNIMGPISQNVPMDMLSGGAGFMPNFQELVHFSDAGSFSGLLGDFAAGSLGSLKEMGKDFVKDGLSEALTEVAAGAGVGGDGIEGVIVGQAISIGSQIAVDKLDEKVTESIEENVNGEESGSPTENSASAKMIQITGVYAAPQKSLAAAQNYVKNAFFFSTRAGDKFDGVELIDTDGALEIAEKNRYGYYTEVFQGGLSAAYEYQTSGVEEAQKRMDSIKQQIKSAGTFDAQKGAQTLVTQEEFRQRITRLSLLLNSIEQELARELMRQPSKYLIERSAEQIKQSTAKQISDLNKSKEDKS